MSKLRVLILAAGHGQRFKNAGYKTPKPLLLLPTVVTAANGKKKVVSKPLLQFAVEYATELVDDPRDVIVVTTREISNFLGRFTWKPISEKLRPSLVVVDHVLNGAALSAERALIETDVALSDSILMLDSDNLFLRPRAIRDYLRAHIDPGTPANSECICHSMYVTVPEEELQVFQAKDKIGALIDAYSKIELDAQGKFIAFKDPYIASSSLNLNIGMYYFQKSLALFNGVDFLRKQARSDPNGRRSEYTILNVLTRLREVELTFKKSWEFPQFKISGFQTHFNDWIPAGSPSQYERLFVKLDRIATYETRS